MKRSILQSWDRLTVIFLGAMIVTGCGDEWSVPRDAVGPLVKIEDLDVVVTRVDRDYDTRTITTVLTSAAAERQITIEPFSTNTLPAGFAAELSGPGGVLYHISLACAIAEIACWIFDCGWD